MMYDLNSVVIMLFFSSITQVDLISVMTLNQEPILSCIEIEPAHPAKRSLIWLHGLGADGSDFVPIVPELKLPSVAGMRFIFPHAPIMPVTLNQGYEMRAWFDIYTIAMDAKIDASGIARSVNSIEKLIERETARGIATNNIILAGFSQGAAIALNTGLFFAKPLAGIIALSGFLPLANDILKKASTANRHIPIFLAHGTEDPIVPYALGKTTYVTLKQAGYSIDWHSYAMAHSVCEAEINDLSKWLRILSDA